MTEKDKLIRMILENEDVIRYKKIEKIINNDKKLKTQMSQLKAIQKQLINAKQIEKKQAIIELESRYQMLLKEIEETPLMSDYLALQGDINEMLHSIQDIIEAGIEKDFE
ncbi:MAG: YlbF family regulator [Acholeplasmataceae bacterium]|nr:YlbF family regulator [Acholeplasmataceae bacterium]